MMSDWCMTTAGLHMKKKVCVPLIGQTFHHLVHHEIQNTPKKNQDSYRTRIPNQTKFLSQKFGSLFPQLSDLDYCLLKNATQC